MALTANTRLRSRCFTPSSPPILRHDIKAAAFRSFVLSILSIQHSRAMSLPSYRRKSKRDSCIIEVDPISLLMNIS